ncbi:HAD family hydrolase [Fimbriimonas ginsengisoli]|uniref:Haloacid dehalogenase n=1 Tax=Fimbriimonas ginsengisoli Gsoil 348 TaxID=661478 RepID=A0A068NQ81_FIMGI|nr:HAD hydrolase-like protein [Fimbriimonas ginsengisoli]AIE85723.1 haloacid dehalogenase [Fimbriimonas ginsengisoli Gsoil 348]
MTNFDSIVFDLDGTLWDTTPACAVAWNDVLAKHGIPYRHITADDVQLVTGKPHDLCIRETFSDLSEEQIRLLIDDTAVEDNAAITRLGGTIYEGVTEGLRRLKERYRLFIVSNCQSGYIETFYAFSNLGELFEDCECFGNTAESKDRNLARVIQRNGLQRPIMVGDAAGDEAAARACRIPFAFVTYGFGTSLAPDFTYHSFPELTGALLAM